MNSVYVYLVLFAILPEILTTSKNLCSNFICRKLTRKASRIQKLLSEYNCSVTVTTHSTTTEPTTTDSTTPGNPCIPNPCQGDSTCDLKPDSELGFKCNCDGVRTGNLCQLCSSCFTSSDCNDLGGVQIEAECQEGEVCCQF